MQLFSFDASICESIYNICFARNLSQTKYNVSATQSLWTQSDANSLQGQKIEGNFRPCKLFASDLVQCAEHMLSPAADFLQGLFYWKVKSNWL